MIIILFLKSKFIVARHVPETDTKKIHFTASDLQFSYLTTLIFLRILATAGKRAESHKL